MEEVMHILPGMATKFHPGEGDAVVIVTNTGRTYLVHDSIYSCYIVDGQYYSAAQHFMRWLNLLEKNGGLAACS